MRRSLMPRRRFEDPIGLSLFDRFLGEPVFRSIPFPAVDVEEKNDRYLIKADVPGFSKENIEIEVVNDLLTINGTTDEQQEREGDGFLHKERRTGHFSRSFTLPDNSKPDDITAEFKDGVVTITVPKKEKTTPNRRQIELH